MISKATIQTLRGLHEKKIRRERTLFIAEGSKTVAEILDAAARGVLNYPLQAIYAVQDWADAQRELIARAAVPLHIVDEDELKKISALVTPNQVLAVLSQHADTAKFPPQHNHYAFLLDGIRDPGNLGTIIRIADWFGMSHIYCSDDCAELFNPKTIQSTMGSFMRVRLTYLPQGDDSFFEANHLPVFGALLSGTDIRKVHFPATGGLIMIGNESQGIRPDWQRFITQGVLIKGSGRAESLNAAVSAGIIASFLFE